MNDTPMASRLPPVAIDPPRTPTTPSFVITDTGVGEPKFPFSRDDDDDDDRCDRDRDRRYLDSPVAHSPPRSHFLAASPRSSPAAFLHPHHSTSLHPPTPDSAFLMATEDGLANGGSDAPAPKNPFNFQTQFISTGPVKSVCCPVVLDWRRAAIRPAD